MQPIRMEGTLEIKLKGGNKGLDHWEEVFAVLAGETLSLFKDRRAAAQRTSRWPPISLVGAVCRENALSRRKENTIRLTLQDGSQYMFAASSRELQLLWIKKLQKCSESSSSDSDDSGRASSVNLSLEKLAEAPDDPTKPADRRGESLERQSSTEGLPPPKPPHTYYNRHRYSEEAEGGSAETPSGRVQPPSAPPPAPPDTQDPPAGAPQLTDDNGNKQRKNVFRKFFSKK